MYTQGNNIPKFGLDFWPRRLWGAFKRWQRIDWKSLQRGQLDPKLQVERRSPTITLLR